MARLPVRTLSGIRLGRVSSWDLDVETGKLAAIHVLPGVAVRLMTDELVIPWTQIVEITTEVVIVVDATVPIGVPHLARAQET